MSEMLIQQYGIFLIGAGLSLVVFLLLFLILRRRAAKSKSLRPTAQNIFDEMAQKDSENDGMPTLDSLQPEITTKQPDDADGFQLFKRKSKSTNANPAQASDDMKRLVDIEQEMLAIRELFRQGEISRSVYVAETKALYETARLVKE